MRDPRLKLIAWLKVADGGAMEGIEQRVELGLALGAEMERLAKSVFASKSWVRAEPRRTKRRCFGRSKTRGSQMKMPIEARGDVPTCREVS